MAKQSGFSVVSTGKLIPAATLLETKLMDLTLEKSIETATSKGRTQFSQRLRVRIHDVTLDALLSHVLRAVVIRFQQWIRAKGDAAGEAFMKSNPVYVHDISAELRSAADPVTFIRSSADPIAALHDLIAKAGYSIDPETGKIKAS